MASHIHAVFMNVASTGHVNPTLPIVKELTSRGCAVTYFVGDDVRSIVEAAGATWHGFRYDTSTDTGLRRGFDQAGSDKFVPPGTPSDFYNTLPDSMLYVAGQLLPNLIEDLRALPVKPTVIVYDQFVPAALVASKMLCIPAVCMVTVAGPGVLAPMLQRWTEIEAQPWVDGPRRQIDRTFGVDVLARAGVMQFYSPTQNIVATIDDLFYPLTNEQGDRFGELPFRCVGALVDTTIKRIANLSADSDLSAFPSARIDEAIQAGKRVLYVSLGTVATSVYWQRPLGVAGAQNGLEHVTGKQFSLYVWRTMMEVFGEDEKVLVVMALGGRKDALDDLPKAPSNFVLALAVPQLEVLQKCHAFVSHGGAGSVHESLLYGVPLAIVPLFSDQPINGEAVQREGAGMLFPRPMEDLHADSARELIGKLLQAGDNPYRAAAQRLAEKMRNAGGAAAAADLVLEVCSKAK